LVSTNQDIVNLQDGANRQSLKNMYQYLGMDVVTTYAVMLYHRNPSEDVDRSPLGMRIDTARHKERRNT
jgi:hypothetical protein